MTLIFADFKIELDRPVPAEFKAVNQKGVNTLIIVDELGFTYSSSKTKGGGYRRDSTLRTWRCSKKNKQCIATVTTENSWIVSRRNIHNHEPVQVFRSEVVKPDDQMLQDFFSNH